MAEQRRAKCNADRLTHAYATTLAHRLPLLYCVVIFNVAVLAVSFHKLAPPALTIAAPVFLVLVLVARAIHWLPSRVAKRSHDAQRRDLEHLAKIGGWAAFACTIWALALYPHGDIARQSLVHYLTAITCFVGILGLGQSPRTALRMTLVTILPATAWFALHGHPNALPICAVQLMISALLLLITNGHHQDFVALELSRQELAAREQDTARLARTIQFQASRDTLTGAASRGAILGTLEAMLADRTRPSPWLAVVDLDGFKHVNDTFGHPAGDVVLRTVCERIEALPAIRACGRLGGDEFALLLDESLATADVSAALKGLIAEISRPIPYESYELTVSASIGLCLTAHGSLKDCLERADEALYRAKRLAGGAIAEFGSEDERARRARAEITRVFCTADLASRISVVYQPTVDLDLSKTASYEALARWNTIDGEELSPDTFIPLAESTGRIGEITQLVLERALCECPAWTFGKQLSVNLSSRDILRDDAAAWLGNIVAQAGAPPRAIIFEITESALNADFRRAARTLEALRQSGFRIALDDFGTGQSSLSQVHQLPLDHIKLDRSFARDLETSRAGRAVAATMLALARQLDLSCSIEGIESAAQAAAARSLGFRLMQGYYLGRPLAAATALEAERRAA